MQISKNKINLLKIKLIMYSYPFHPAYILHKLLNHRKDRLNGVFWHNCLHIRYLILKAIEFEEENLMTFPLRFVLQ